MARHNINVLEEMRIENFILSIVKKLENTYPGIIAFAYKDGNLPRTYVWWSICITDFEIYMHDKRFKTLTHAWHAAAKARGERIVFFCCSAKEKNLKKFAEEGNLIMNI